MGSRKLHKQEKNMKIREIIGDIIGVVAIFGGGYVLLVIGYGLGY